MTENIIVIGTGSDSHLTGKSVGHLMPSDTIIADAEKVKESLPFPKSEPFILHNPYPPELKYINEGKAFVCKGKHQYRQVRTTQEDGFILVEWKCQCSKTI